MGKKMETQRICHLLKVMKPANSHACFLIFPPLLAPWQVVGLGFSPEVKSVLTGRFSWPPGFEMLQWGRKNASPGASHVRGTQCMMNMKSNGNSSCFLPTQMR